MTSSISKQNLTKLITELDKLIFAKKETTPGYNSEQEYSIFDINNKYLQAINTVIFLRLTLEYAKKNRLAAQNYQNV